ncbi:MAG: choice-of-anchor C family protein [Ottowia sp.]|uniref:choice-of-anchor C family protein n=1 Tax=unclassified Ottowia TaxID=2645081 RepID=UPI003C2BB432
MSKKTMGAAAATLLLAATAYAAPFQNGSFEQPGISGGGDINTLPAGNTYLPGWTVTGVNVDYLSTYWQAADGTHSLDLSGTGAGGVQQTFDTVAGHRYRVRFALAGNPDGTSNPVKTVVVQATGGTAQTYTFDTTGHSGSNMGWVTETYTFVATGASATLSFVSQDNSFYGPALDNVAVADVTPTAVPTLSEWALIGLAGLLGLFALRGRKLISSLRP